MIDENQLDAVVIGGGFYGTAIANYLVAQRGLRQVMLVEREPKLLSRASYNNQARVHSGYHYPRSFTTAYRSRVNFPNFVRDWQDVIKKDFSKLYAIARHNSKVSARQFRRFCEQIGARIQVAPADYRALFDPRLIEAVFLVEEYAFDADKLALWAGHVLGECGIWVQLQTQVTSISVVHGKCLQVKLARKDERESHVNCRYVFNCTYSGLNQLGGDFPSVRTGLKQEITEMALLSVPQQLQSLSITVMDGPFFSIVPFPSRALHTLSHVRYTPHQSWQDQRGHDPYLKLESYERASRVDRMIRDAGRYIPVVSESAYKGSLYEIKTVLAMNEGDDGRPILFEKYSEMPGCYSILGGKIDNIYDVLEKLNAESLS